MARPSKSAAKHKGIRDRFCSCIKKVRSTVKLRPSARRAAKTKRLRTRQRESAAIGICVKSVLQTRGLTLKRFSCEPANDAKPYLQTQAPLSA